MHGRLFDPSTVSAHQFEPVGFVQEGARRYAAERGMKWEEPDPQLQNTHVRGHVQQQAYREAMNRPDERRGIAKSYEHATQHIGDQYDFMTRPEHEGGLGIKHEVVTDDPYDSPHAMAEDLRVNRRIRTYATATTSAGAEQAPTNQAFDNDTNDKFRAVHDVFGHAAIGRGFSRHGEEAAFVSHRQMFPPQAHAALASETRGQNSYLNYGKENEFPDVGSRRIGMPSWASKVGDLPTRVVSRAQRQSAPQGEQGRLF